MSNLKKISSARFLASKDTVVAAMNACVNVRAGREYEFPAYMFDAALSANMTPLGPLEVVTKAEEDGTPDRRSLAEKEEILVGICKQLIERGDPKTFTQLLKPKVYIVREMVDFEFTKQSLLRAYDKAVLEVDQSYANDSDSTVDSDYAERPATE